MYSDFTRNHKKRSAAMNWLKLKGRVETLQASGKLPKDFELVARNINGECSEIQEVRLGVYERNDDEGFDVVTAEDFADLEDPDEQALYQPLDSPTLILNE
jgi:hypothetical protein